MGWLFQYASNVNSLLWELQKRSMSDKYNTIAPGSRNNREYRPITALTPRSSDWKASESSRAKSRDGLPGNNSEMRRVRAKFRAGKTLTPEEKALLAKMKSMIND